MNRIICLSAGVLMAGLLSALAQIKPLVAEHYYDETSQRFLTILPQSFGKVQVVIRGPGGWRWFGDGEKTEKLMVFAQTIGEGQERGTFFMAKGGESKWEIGFKPGQRTPQDAGINGVFRRVSDEKRLQLARKEYQAAETALDDSLKTATKSATGPDRVVLGEWRTRWQALRERWVAIAYAMPAAPKAVADKPLPFGAKPPPPAHERQPDYWFTMAETTGRGMAFIAQPIDKTAPVDWDGAYDDGFGGQVNLRLDSKGKLRVALSFSRAADQFTGALSGDVDPLKITVDKEGAKTAELDAKDVAMAEGAQPAPPVRVRLRRTGRFLVVETEKAGKAAGRGWFDGIYRWAPLPKE